MALQSSPVTTAQIMAQVRSSHLREAIELLGSFPRVIEGPRFGSASQRPFCAHFATPGNGFTFGDTWPYNQADDCCCTYGEMCSSRHCDYMGEAPMWKPTWRCAAKPDPCNQDTCLSFMFDYTDPIYNQPDGCCCNIECVYFRRYSYLY